jgi:hypothetical protein
MRSFLLVVAAASLTIAAPLNAASTGAAEPPQQPWQPIMVEWPDVDPHKEAPSLRLMPAQERTELLHRLIEPLAAKLPKEDLPSSHTQMIAEIVRYMELLISADFEAYDELLTSRGAKLTRAPGLAAAFERSFPDAVPKQGWTEMSEREQFAYVWSRPPLRNASWHSMTVLGVGTGLQLGPEDSKYWCVHLRSAYNLADTDKLAHAAGEGKATCVWVRLQVDFDRKVGDIRLVFVYDEQQKVWLPLMVDHIGRPRDTLLFL